MRDEAIIVSLPQLETAETVTVYLCFPPEQLVTLPKTPTLIPRCEVTVLNVGVATLAQPVVAPPPFDFCADIGIDNIATQANAITLAKTFLIVIITSLSFRIYTINIAGCIPRR